MRRRSLLRYISPTELRTCAGTISLIPVLNLKFASCLFQYSVMAQFFFDWVFIEDDMIFLFSISCVIFSSIYVLLLCERELQILPATVTKLTDVPSETTCGESATVICGETSLTMITAAYHGKNCLFLFIYVLVFFYLNFFLFFVCRW